MRTLKNDPRGTAAWIEREARGMNPLQLYREFVQNGIEARLSDKYAVVTIDGWTDPQTQRRLARITDNGCGMNRQQLIERLTNLHGQYKA
ncbi:ATP-binding protein, partial [Mycobacterium sp.]|uniref:ATP-binding protein n=1 Tax=Mycobacterium sp. TaxID=1785 RepID=UPI002C4AA2F7